MIMSTELTHTTLRVLFPPDIQRSDIKGAHLVSPTFLSYGLNQESSPNDQSLAIEQQQQQQQQELTEDDVSDAMEAVHYFTYSLPILRNSLKKADHTHSTSSSSSNSNPYGMIEFLQYPGETVFIPHGWYHAVINLTPTIAITQNYVSQRNFTSAFNECRMKRIHMTQRWREQLMRHQHDLAELTQQIMDQLNTIPTSNITSSLQSTTVDVSNDSSTSSSSTSTSSLATSAPTSSSSSTLRRPDIDYLLAESDPDSWYWNPSSDEDEDDNGDDDDAYATHIK